MQVIHKIAELRQIITQHKQLGKVIGLVPTMGYLHKGHAELILSCNTTSDISIVSIFVNPLQFGPNEDLTNYPRNFAADVALCTKNKVDILFAPAAEELLGNRMLACVNIDSLDKHLCGAKRSGHFRGVCTIVSKLFNIVTPDNAYFGQKDIQQLRIIQKMVADLNYNIKIVEVATVREADGLALSSRNSYLSIKERKLAVVVPQTIQFIVNKFLAKEPVINIASIISAATETVEQTDTVRVDYIEIVDSETLAPTTDLTTKIIIAVAIFIGKTRLIDNQILNFNGMQP